MHRLGRIAIRPTRVRTVQTEESPNAEEAHLTEAQSLWSRCKSFPYNIQSVTNRGSGNKLREVICLTGATHKPKPLRDGFTDVGLSHSALNRRTTKVGAFRISDAAIPSAYRLPATGQ
jgi:hypothetical protein